MAKNSKVKCLTCTGKGMMPWCPTCFKTGLQTPEEAEERRKIQEAKDAESLRLKSMSNIERFEYERLELIQRTKARENKKLLKKGLDVTLKNRKLLRGIPELDSIIKTYINEAIETIHEEIDDEILTELPAVIAKFNSLIEEPDYSHQDRTKEELEEYLKGLSR